jgi:hypothetical protein
MNREFPNYDHEVRNCSITEIEIGEKGPGEFIRHGDWSHIFKALESDPKELEELEDSTGDHPLKQSSRQYLRANKL